jgi:hypothetical protein
MSAFEARRARHAAAREAALARYAAQLEWSAD